MKKLGSERSLKAKKEKEGKKKRVTCERCGDEFPNEVSLSKHVERGWCKTEEEMTEKELMAMAVALQVRLGVQSWARMATAAHQ